MFIDNHAMPTGIEGQTNRIQVGVLRAERRISGALTNGHGAIETTGKKF